MSNTSVRIAIDIGGTFTDIQVLFEGTGRCYAHKTPTTPDDPSVGLMNGIREASTAFHFELADVCALMHGTTIATNAVLQRQFPEAALITTSGFEDVLEIGRHVRKDVYSQIAEERPILVPRRYRFGVTERVTAAGRVDTPLDADSAQRVVDAIAQAGIRVVAVSLLHAYANSTHEERLRAQLEEKIPGVYVSVSSQTSPQAREYERTSTTVLNALLMPVVRDYLDRLDQRMAEAGFRPPLFLVQSNGGVTTPDIARDQPVRLVLSGPSGGARAGEVLADQLGEPNLVGVDMGGTSFDVSVIENGLTRMRSEGDVGGAPVRLPMLEIRTVGSGGGSLATASKSGRLTVGPQSAGADPGPVAYARGGTHPTVTDANLSLGRIDPDYFLGGAMRLDADAAKRAVSRQIAQPLGLGPEQAAEGIVRIAISDMAGAIRLSLFEKGLDPKDFALVSFGGAGGLHTALVADELGAQRVLFPQASGTLSAWGMLFADVVQDIMGAQLTAAGPDGASSLTPLAETLFMRGREALDRAGVLPDKQTFSLAMEMRYPGQGYELSVDVGDVASGRLEDSVIALAVARFHDQHQSLFAHSETSVIPEIVTLRLRAQGWLDKPISSEYVMADGHAIKGKRDVFLDGRWHSVNVFARERIAAGAQLDGPAIVEERHSTILLPRGWQAAVDESGVILAVRSQSAATSLQSTSENV